MTTTMLMIMMMCKIVLEPGGPQMTIRGLYGKHEIILNISRTGRLALM